MDLSQGLKVSICESSGEFRTKRQTKDLEAILGGSDIFVYPYQLATGSALLPRAFDKLEN